MTVLSLERLPVYYQLLISELENENQSKIFDQIRLFTSDGDNKTYSGLGMEELTPLQALARALLELRQTDHSFNKSSLTAYITFKIALDTGFSKEWEKIHVLEEEKDLYLYFSAEEAFAQHKYGETINLCNYLLSKYSQDVPHPFNIRMLTIDSLNLKILAEILLGETESARNSINFYFKLIPQLKGESWLDISNVWHWSGKHKELLLFYLTKQTKRADQIVKAFVSERKDLKDYYVLGTLYALVGVYELSQERFEAGESHLRQSLSQFQLLGSDVLVNNLRSHFLAIYLWQGNLREVARLAKPKDEFPSLRQGIILCWIYVIIGQESEAKELFIKVVERVDEGTLDDASLATLFYTLVASLGTDEQVRNWGNKISTVANPSSMTNLTVEEKVVLQGILGAVLQVYRGDVVGGLEKLNLTWNQATSTKALEQTLSLNIHKTVALVKRYSISPNDDLVLAARKSLNQLLVYLSSINQFETKLQALLAIMYFELATHSLGDGLDHLSKAYNLIKDQKVPFYRRMRNDLAKLSTNLQQSPNNKLLALIAELNETDIASSFISAGLFVPKHIKIANHIWASYCLQQTLTALQTIVVQTSRYVEGTGVKSDGVPGVIRFA